MAADDADKLDELEELIYTALYDTGGEMVEGAFVDRWEPNSGVARDELQRVFQRRNLSPAERARLHALLRDPHAPRDPLVELFAALMPAVEALVVEALHDPLPATRATALRVASRSFNISLMVAALRDPHPQVRAAALQSMVDKRQVFPVVEEHLPAALQDESPEVRLVAARAVRFYKEPAGAEALLRCFEAESDGRVRDAIVTNLAKMTNNAGISHSATDVEAGIGAGVKALLLAQLNHKQAEMRELVARALQRLRGVEVATALLERLLVEQNQHVRHLLLLYMGYAAIAERALPIFTKMLAHDPDPVVRTRVAWLLEPFGAPAIPALIQALDNAGDPRRAAAMTLAHIGDVRALPALTRELANPSDFITRHEITSAIRAILIDARPRPPIPDISAYIQGEIDALLPKSFGDWPIRVCKEELNALPLHSSILFIWALRPDGTMLCMDHEAFGHPTEPETDELIIFASLVKGARTHRHLQELIPLPPQGTEVCLACNATGFASDEQASIPWCVRCSGHGWLLPGR